MIFKFFTSAWSNLENREERQKFSILSILFGVTIGVLWLLRPLKDGCFLTMVGANYIPKVKIISMFITIPIVIIYEGLVSNFKRNQVLYGLSIFYALSIAIFAALILHPTIGMGNTVASVDRYFGWLFYLFVESFGPIMVMLFWSFVAETTTPDSAKRGYSLIALGAQIGGVLGPLMGHAIMSNENATETINRSGLAAILSVIGLCFIPCIVFYFMRNVSKEQMQGFKPDENKAPLEGTPKSGLLEGLQLLGTKPYLLGIFVVVSFYEIVVTFLDFQFKSLIRDNYQGDMLTTYLFKCAIYTNGVALICLLLGAGKVCNKLGISKTLLLLPSLVLISVITLYMHPTLNVALLVIVCCNGLNFAFNQPIKEQLYIPTTKDSKYRAKAWIDGFGLRFSKGLGSVVNDSKNYLGAELFPIIVLTTSFGLIGIWVFAALFLGKTHAQAIKENRTVC